MKHLLCLPVLALFLTLAMPAMAQNSDDATLNKLADQILNSPDASTIKSQLRALATVLDIETDAPVATNKDTPGTTTTETKTLADVGDRALDLAEGMIQSISSKMEDIAPKVWGILIRQQYGKAMANLVVPIGLILLILVFRWRVRHNWQNRWTESPICKFWFTLILPLAAIFGLGCWGAVEIKDSVKFLINPEYYAIRDLISLLLGKGQL
jgi:hypothetical protein